MKAAVKKIPEALIYEMMDGVPIYYRDYDEVLSGNKQIEEVMGSSYLQSLIITKLVILLGNKLGKSFRILTNEIGLRFSKNSWRAADIAIIEKSRLEDVQLVDAYLDVPPNVVIEIDTKAAIGEVDDPIGYYHKKTDELLAFGTEKIIWIFTHSRKIMIAEKGKNWEIIDWKTDVEVINGLTINIQNLLEDD